MDIVKNEQTNELTCSCLLPLASELVWSLSCVGSTRLKCKRWGEWITLRHCHLNGVLLTAIVGWYNDNNNGSGVAM